MSQTITAKAEDVQITTKSRIEVIDALRGFALYGILLTHVSAYYIGAGLKHSNHDPNHSLMTTNFMVQVVKHFINGRMYGIFSFLFGLSFVIQITSSRLKNKPFVGRFIWRLAILLFIGYLDNLVFKEDILQLYAILGLLLLICNNLSDKNLLIISALLLFISVVCVFYNQEIALSAAPVFNKIENSEFLGFLDVHKFKYLLSSGRIFLTPCFFLLGLYAGRRKIFSFTPENLILFKRLFVFSGIVVLISAILFFTLQFTNADPENLDDAIYVIVRFFMSIIYLVLIVRLYRSKRSSILLAPLIPLGQMGLTIYIMQSFFMLMLNSLNVFYFKNIGLDVFLILCTGFFGFQIAFAYFWMAKFKFGPIEWLWRTLTYLKWQPFLRNRE
jgi:uncharacterized protein